MSSFVLSIPQELSPGTYGSTVERNGEPIYLRMELLTSDNCRGWQHFKESTHRMANSTRGILTYLLSQQEDPPYESTKNMIGFSEAEYDEFMRKVKEMKKTNGKILDLIRANSTGSGFIDASYNENERRYIVYAAKNPSLSIRNINIKPAVTLKEYIENYSDILIAVGSDFTRTDVFHNRGIFRNPLCVLEGKYSGLSMLLHGFCGAVAEKFDHLKESMEVAPVGSMQVIIKKILKPGEGVCRQANGEIIDITEVNTSATSTEGGLDIIKVSALTRIYTETVAGK